MRCAAGGSTGHPAAVALLAVLVLVIAGCGASGSSKGPTAPAGASSAGGQALTLDDLAYAHASDQEQLDLYLPAGAARPAPVVVWFHGGGWRVGDKSQIGHGYDPNVPVPTPTSCNQVVQAQVPDVTALNGKGYAVAAVNYRLVQNPVAAVQDAKAAVRFLRANASKYHLDPNRFAAWGESAGAYSVIMLGVTGTQKTVFDDPALGNPDVPATVQAVVDWFGPTDSAQIPGHLGVSASPFTYIRAGQSLPAFRIANGDDDCVVPVHDARRLNSALLKAGATATLAVLPGARHEDPAFMRTQLTPTLAFLDQTLDQ